MADIMQALRDHRFSGSLTLEIEDLTFDHALSDQKRKSTCLQRTALLCVSHAISAGFIKFALRI